MLGLPLACAHGFAQTNEPAADALSAVSTPTFSPPARIYDAIQTVRILDATPNATIYYTTDGSAPNTATSKRYTSPLTVDKSETIQAIATASGHVHSSTGSASYTLNLPQAEAPVFALKAGTYSNEKTLTISDRTPGAKIYYTTDGSMPTTSSIPYGGSIEILATMTVQAIADAEGYVSSEVTSATYKIWPPIPVSKAWKWMSGSNESLGASVYGRIGILDPANVPGARERAVSWTDSVGNLWIFGGNGCTASMSCGESQLNDLWEFVPAANQWRWVGGTQKYEEPGIYGRLGIAAAGNVPGARTDAVGWTDSVGRLWLFGGAGFDKNDSWSALNDLWQFDPSTRLWTWMGGNSAVVAPCYPTWGGSNGSCGVAGIYGERGKGEVANAPGSRSDASSWTDATGNLWMFGGTGYDSVGNPGLLNDLWRYNVATHQWAWMSGNGTIPLPCAFGIPPGACGIPGLYGQRGIAAAANVPGARSGAAAWTDKNSNLWLFGGYGYDSNGEAAWLNDLWKYDISSGQWTWISGSAADGDTGGQPTGVYGIWQMPAASSTPGGRHFANAWKDAKGNLWLFGGTGFDSTENIGYLNDLWMFNPVTSEWTWMAGSSSTNSAHGFENGPVGLYGELQTPFIGNAPGGRSSAAQWTDKQGNFWLMGGYGMGAIAEAGILNDLWSYEPRSNAVHAAAAPKFSPSEKTVYAGREVTLSDSTPGATLYYLATGMAEPVQYTQPIVVAASSTIVAMAVAPGYANSMPERAVYTVPTTAKPVFSLASGIYASAKKIAISDANKDAVIYYTTDGTQPTSASPVYSGPIVVSSSETIQAYAIAERFQASTTVSNSYTIWPKSDVNSWAWMSGANSTSGTGVWGVLGVPTPSNTPSARNGQASWVDAEGNLWLFGGYGYDANDNSNYLDDLWKFTPSLNEWAWMGGIPAAPKCDVTVCGQPGTYGQRGKAAASNFPGARSGPAYWTDVEGKLWLFGGYGYDAAGTPTELNDLWSFQPQTGQWTWVSGSNVASNCISVPLEFAVCGGSSPDYGTLGIASSLNNPGAREGANIWIDNAGEVWMFGGLSFLTDGAMSEAAEYYLNDLWRFNPSSRQWTWVSGGSDQNDASCVTNPNSYLPTCGQPGVYGRLGVAAKGNAPGGRQGATAWMDKSGNLWLLGGFAFDENGEVGNLDDMWEFDVASSEWTWKKGPLAGPPCGMDFGGTCLTPFLPGVYGTKGVAAAKNIPGFVSEAPGWTDRDGNFWLLGGAGLDALWEFSPLTNEWTWVGGSNASSAIAPVPPVYGIQGVPALRNTPGYRTSAAVWTDKAGAFWLMGGNAVSIRSGTMEVSNDLWTLHP